MFKEDYFWHFVASLVCITAISLMLTITTYYRHQDRIIAQMVADGEEPMEALCSMTDTFGTMPLCIALASK